ncbi:MAG: hypothetical protein HZB26_10275 [Candidatus Hydrogenedentes bacterium]|nr:hypothetical protein [Candidatus Hydrogenedentota bacterium]
MRYLGYVTSPHTRLDPDKNKPPAVVITAKFVEKAISLVENHLRAVFMSDLTRTALALKDFKAAHGQYPNKLEDAIPEFLPKVPIVPWTGQPIVYTAPDPVSGAGFALSSDVRSWPNLRDTLWSAAR